MLGIIALIIILFAICMMSLGLSPRIMWKNGKPANAVENPTILHQFLCYVLPPLILCGSFIIGMESIDSLSNGFAIWFLSMCVIIGWFFITIFGSIILASIIKKDVNVAFMVSSWIGFILIGLVVAVFLYAQVAVK